MFPFGMLPRGTVPTKLPAVKLVSPAPEPVCDPENVPAVSVPLTVPLAT